MLKIMNVAFSSQGLERTLNAYFLSRSQKETKNFREPKTSSSRSARITSKNVLRYDHFYSTRVENSRCLFQKENYVGTIRLLYVFKMSDLNFRLVSLVIWRFA